jgi:5'-nucleotidase (lipoprotein e(P4) family)
MIARKTLVLAAVLTAFSGTPARAQDAVPASDMLLATLWTQRAIEYKANALTVFTLARIRLDEALADKSWTAAPGEQKGDFQGLPPAVILDVDETLIDNSRYQVWMLKNNQSFSTKTWNEFCAAQISTAIPGAVEFVKYAESKGVKIFYITNRDAVTEKDTRENMQSSASRWAATSTPSLCRTSSRAGAAPRARAAPW